MKKLACFSFAVLLCSTMYGQTVAAIDTISVTKYSYCEIVGSTNLLQTKTTIVIDFGQATKFFEDKRYKDPATGKPFTFNSMVDALNFMGKQGWNFAAAYTIGNAQNGYVYHFLLKKIDSDNQKE